MTCHPDNARFGITSIKSKLREYTVWCPKSLVCLNIIAVSYLYEAHQREIKTETHKVK